MHLADSAFHAPQAGFGDHDAYPDLIDKSRVGLAPLNNRFWGPLDHDDGVKTMLAVASTSLEIEWLATWLRAHTT